VAGWYVSVVLPTEEAFAPIRAMQQNMLLAAIVLTLLAGVLTWWMLRRQLAPMLATVKTLAALSDTNQPPQPLPVARQDEVGELIGGFNRLLKTLAQREEALKESEERYRTLVEWSREAIVVHRGGKLIYVNPAGIKIIGAKSAQDLVGKPFLDFIHPDFRQIALARAKNIANHRVIAPMIEGKFLKLDGTAIDAEVQSTPIVYDGEPAIQVAMRDITERKRADKALFESEEQLRAAEEQFRGLVEQPITGIYIIQNGVFVYVNPRFAEIFGSEPRDITGMEVPALVAGCDRDLVLENMRMLYSGAVTSIEFEFAGQRKDGTLVDIGVHGTSSVHNGKPAIIGVLQDISGKRRAEEEIRSYIEQLKTAFMSTVDVAMTMGEMRDPYTVGHERRVADLAVAIGAELGFDARRQEGLLVAGRLHDVGKIAVPADILSKPGKLDSIEFQLIQEHTQAGYDVLKSVEFPWPVAQIALQHHERMDGSGYPQGLKGESILLEARIMAVADVVEAMSSHRPYRPALGIDKALVQIEEGRGALFDSNAVDACLRLFREDGYQLSV
jgi:PAS domain S-box-containing protein